MKVEIDNESGFCFGVLSAIGKAEEELRKSGQLFCLGDIVHNGIECDRLQRLGLRTINHDEYSSLHNTRVLLRAHGEPPSTYAIARKNGITLVDATCPVVLKLQQRIHMQFEKLDPATQQIVIFGQKGHAEILGLVGQTDGNVTVIESADEIDRIDFSKDIFLYSQTTKSLENYNQLIEKISNRIHDGRKFVHNNTVCGQVSHRREKIRDFAQRHDVILFVSGRKSSNGKVLFNEIQKVNPESYMIESCDDIDYSLLSGAESIGICGATSTPKWLMEECRNYITDHFRNNSIT
ncbi:MAG: 4-hydroxy-3-methylbut-2-enyl diphosphate reductase [Bacteroidaceae bacterium]|nr:4-hydroxy-3-methylbut-2-enyl diphosphate reductase [Bacteroidaceae bacterium]